MARKRVERVMARRVAAGADGPAGRTPDAVAVEEPLEIRFGETTVATTMRTPGHDFELAAGWCHAEGLLPPGATVAGIRYCATGSAVDTDFNVVTVEAARASGSPASDVVVTPRLTASTAACGVCGSQTIDELVDRLAPLALPVPDLDVAVAAAVAAEVKSHQELFASTGAVHGAAVFDLVSGALGPVREDVGRHNAVDKVVGRLLLDGGLPAAAGGPDLGLYVTGRAGFELVQKAWAGGFRWLVAVGGPSSLAVDTARRANLGLLAFLRGGSATVYVP